MCIKSRFEKSTFGANLRKLGKSFQSLGVCAEKALRQCCRTAISRGGLSSVTKVL